ncbi:MAG: hypothetical protein R2827_10630 [Bdellovibrionales bacterium]
MHTDHVEEDKKINKTSVAGLSSRELILAKRNTIFTNDFSEEVFNLTYKFAGETDINDRHLLLQKI